MALLLCRNHSRPSLCIHLVYNPSNATSVNNKQGDFDRNQFHGKGMMTYKGETYEGDWYKNKRTGKGKMTFLDNEVYEGEFDENVMNGEGIMYFTNGDVYRGKFQEGVRHGPGVLQVHATGETLVEEWHQGGPVSGVSAAVDWEGVDLWLRDIFLRVGNSGLDAWQALSEAVVSLAKQHGVL